MIKDRFEFGLAVMFVCLVGSAIGSAAAWIWP
jgi:hypothetical protein